ncbi:ferredoxin reductase family protein [Pararhodonellum marinum]|uniref:ferredoxin reductase family protein n=1 Tax=Pararhodonellum marinum TaxID=2755358 RepID=UPI00188E5E52|nr:ferric reductase-like transmembrane domain-containing protein [Pararhodonellum marinum]
MRTPPQENEKIQPYSYGKGIFWILVFVILSLVPIGISLLGDVPDARDFWMEFGVALGFLGLGIMGSQFIFTGRLSRVAPTFGPDNIFHFHKTLGIVGFVFILAHPVILILNNSEFINYYNPVVNLPRAVALSVVTVAITFLILTSLWRVSFGLSYEKWRLLHGILALLVVFIGVAHAVQVSHYLDPLWKKALLSTALAGCGYFVIHTRLIRPWFNKKMPYEIMEVQSERHDSYTLVMKPRHGPKMQFISGQFAWITINETPFSLQQHPFTFSSSPDSDFISFTSKESGDFTETWKNIKPGTTAYLEGPFGSFTLMPTGNIFMVMGGIGVTPGISMLRTLKSRNDQRAVTLIYGSNDYENIVFREELDLLENDLNLNLVHLLMEPHEDWSGESGEVDKALLEKYLPEDKDACNYYLCGPGPMMDITELNLRELGVDWRLIYSERFKIV